MNGPGRTLHKRNAVSWAVKKFPNDEIAEEWIVQIRWGDEITIY